MGTLKEEMRIDTLGLEIEKVLLAPLNFPPFSVGRRAVWAASSAATSVTARSQGARSRR